VELRLIQDHEQFPLGLLKLLPGFNFWIWSSTISIYKPNSNSASFGRSLERKRTQVGYDMGTEFLTRLARGLRQKPYPGSGRESGSESRVKAKSLPGVVVLAGLSSGKAKPLTQAGLSLIPLSRVMLGWVRPYPLTRAG
jgi:hypothetical protein